MPKSAAGAVALQNLTEVQTHVVVAIASWSAGALSRFRKGDVAGQPDHGKNQGHAHYPQVR